MTLSPLTDLIVNGVLAVLLVVATVACVMVYRRLETIRKSQSEMAHLVSGLNNAVLDAQRSIAELKHVAAQSEAELKVSIDKARKISDELSLISEAGNNLADRIERNLTGGHLAASHAAHQAGVAAGQAAFSGQTAFSGQAGHTGLAGHTGHGAQGSAGAKPEAPTVSPEKQAAILSALKKAR